MTGDVLDIVLANVAYAVLGIGLAALLGVFDRRRTTYADALIGLPLGIAAVMLVAGYAAILGFAVTPTVITLLAVAAATSGGWRLYRRRSALRPERDRMVLGRASRGCRALRS